MSQQILGTVDSREGPDERAGQIHGEAQRTRPEHLLLGQGFEVMAKEEVAHLVRENAGEVKSLLLCRL